MAVNWNEFEPVGQTARPQRQAVDWDEFTLVSQPAQPEPQGVDWSQFEPVQRTYTPEEVRAMYPDMPTPEQQAVESDPWIDPTTAVAGPLGFASKAGAAATAKALGAALATEPIVGGVAEMATDAMDADTPEWAKTAVGIGTSLATAGFLTRGARAAGDAFDKVAPTVGRKSQVMADEFRARFMPKPEAAAEAVDDAGALQIAEGVKLHANPIAEAWDAFKGAYSKYIGTPIWDVAVQKKLPELLEKVPGGTQVNKALIYGYRGDLPEAGKLNVALEDMKVGRAVGADYGIDLGKRLQSVPEADQIKLGQYTRGEADALPENIQALGDEAKDALYHLGKQAVQVGLLDEQVFFKNAGKYMPRLYTTKEYQGLLHRYGEKAPNKMDLSRFKARKDIPKEIREQMGEILTPGYPVAKGVAQLTHDIEMAKFFGGVARNPQWAVPEGAQIPQGFSRLEGRKFGALNGMYVHPEIHAELSHLTHKAGSMERGWNKALGMWKFGKVILSPKTHMRNVLSNSVLAHLGGLPMYEQPYWLAKAAREMRAGGAGWEAAKRSGLLEQSFVNQELRGLFGQVESSMSGIKPGGLEDSLGVVGKGIASLRSAGKKAADVYQAEEQWFKLAMFMRNASRGMPAKAAAADAEKWLFNYGKLTRFQENYRRKWYGAPFATFTFKAMPRIAEAAVKTPWRFALPMAAIYGLNQAAQNAIGDTDAQRKAKRDLLPDWMGGETMWPRVPIVDEHGREHYLNLEYILPWGDLTEGDGGLGIPGGLMPLSMPFLKEPVEQAFNRDAFWKGQIVRDEDVAGKTGLDRRATAAKARLGHAARTLAPTPFIDAEKAYSALKGQPDYRGRMRDPKVVAADVIGGFKMYPVDYAERVSQEVAKLDPRNGVQARAIYRDIQTLSVKAQAMRKLGKDASTYEKQIQDRIGQLHGLAREVQAVGERYSTIRGR